VSSGGLTTLKNTIVASNALEDCSADTPFSTGYNLDSDGTCGLSGPGDISSVDPLLGPLGDNGGPTLTRALLAGSQAIDGGNPDGCTDHDDSLLTTDQRGAVRSTDGNGDGMATCDIGAYEKSEVLPALVVTKSADTNDGLCDSDCSLREAIAIANESPDPRTIIVPPGEYTLTLGTQLTISNNVNLYGSGAGNDSAVDTIIQANVAPYTATYRVFEVSSGTAVFMQDVHIRHGEGGTGGGGGILNDGGMLTLFRTALYNNSAETAAGILNTGTLSVINSILCYNIASISDGGGIYNSSTAYVANSTLSGNYAPERGGGILNTSSGMLVMSNVTLVDNAANDGGGIFNQGGGTATIKNSILANNRWADCSGTLDSGGYNLIENTNGCTGIDGTDITGRDPVLSPLFNHGGPTETHLLLQGSPALDGGNPDGCTDHNDTLLTTDQRGADRPIDGSGDGTATCDIGAYEKSEEPPPLVVTKWTDTDDGICDFDCSLREAIATANDHPDTHSIIVPAGEYTLTLGQPLTISRYINLHGGGAGGNPAVDTIIQANVSPDTATYQVFNIRSKAVVFMQDVHIRNGGGGIYNDGMLTLFQTSLSKNSTHSNYRYDHGGGILNRATLIIRNSTLFDNSAIDGGGIYNRRWAYVINSTLSGNYARERGGGIWNRWSGTLYLSNATLAGNSADDGGGLFNESVGTINIRNCILADNRDRTRTDFNRTPDCSGTLDSGGYNLIESINGCDGMSDTDITGSDPALSPLVNYEGPTELRLLLPGSPAIDAGNPDGCTDHHDILLTTDQRGAARPTDGNGDGTATCDIGAYEAEELPPLIVTKTADTADGICDSDCSLREAIAVANSAIDSRNVIVPAGVYTHYGELIINNDVNLYGSGDGSNPVEDTIIQGAFAPGTAIHRVFRITSGAAVLMQDLHIRNGRGGISNYGTLTLLQTALSENSAETGGGVFNSDRSTLIITDSTLSGNSATRYGGGIYNWYGGMLIITNSTLSGNSATIDGGGIYSWGGTAYVTNSTLSGNSARERGGGIRNVASMLTLSNATLAGNSADDGGGLSNQDGSTAIIKNSILADNVDRTRIDFNPTPDCSGTLASGGYNLIEIINGCDGIDSTDITGSDPELSPLVNYGRPTEVRLLLPGSPAIDAGNPAGCTDHDEVLLMTDQRGRTRPAGPACDIGAIEVEKTPVGSTVTVQPIDITTGTTPVTVTYTRVNTEGTTGLRSYNCATVFPTGFKLGDPPVCFDLTTTAYFTPPVEVCINYSGIAFASETDLVFSHHEGQGPGGWVPITPTFWDLDADIICGNVDSFSLFAIFEPAEVQTEARYFKESAIDAMTDYAAESRQIAKAIKAIEKSLDLKLWETDSTLTRKGKKVFKEEKKTVKHLMKIVKKKKADQTVKNAAREAIDYLITADAALASTALETAHEALAAAGCSDESQADPECKKALKEIAKAGREMDKAREKYDRGKYDKAVDYYKKAWERARKAMKKASEPEEP